MRRVVDAAEAGVRDRMERKVLKAASMGYTKGVAAGRQAEAQESRAEKAPSAGDAALSAKRAGSDAGVNDAVSLFSEDSAAVATGREAPGGTGGGDSAKEPSAGAPSTPDHELAGNDLPRRAMPPDAGRMPDEVAVGRALGTRRGTRAPAAAPTAAPTAALWALSVSARDGKISGVREDALDLIASRCQLFFAHDKLSRATLGWAAARWRLACAEPRRARATAEHLRRRGARRALARAFAAWARVPESVPEAREALASDRQTDRPIATGTTGTFTNDRAVINDINDGGLPGRGFPDRTEGKPRDGADGVSSASRARDRDRDPFYSPVSAPPPRLDRDVAAGLVDQIEHLKRRNDSLAVALRESRDALEASGPTPREAAQSEKFRAHLQRLQRELEATRLARDAARDSAQRASREAAREATARRSSLKAASTQTGGPGDLSRLDAADRDVAAEATALELRAQAAKFHVEFERQAQIAEAATAKLRDERGVRARAEEAHRREMARARENHAADLAAARGEWEHRARVARANATGAEAAVFSQDFPRGAGPPPPREEPSPESRRLTAERLAALEREAGRMRHSEKVDEKVKGWEVTGVLAEGRAESPRGDPPRDTRREMNEKRRGEMRAGAMAFSESGGGGEMGMPPPAPRRPDPEDPWGDAAASRRRRVEISGPAEIPRAPASAAGSERSTRSRAGTAAAVVAAVRAGGASAVDALLASGALDADDDEPNEVPAFGSHSQAHSRAGSGVGSAAGSGVGSAARRAARAPASATLAVAQLVMRGHAKADADAAVAAAGVDVDAAHAWIARKREGAA